MSALGDKVQLPMTILHRYSLGWGANNLQAKISMSAYPYLKE